MRRFAAFIKQHRSFTVFCILALLVLLAAILAPVLATHDPYEAALADALQPPGAQHWFGMDRLGRDLFSRVIYGTRTSVVSALLLVAVVTAVGSLLGILAGFFGGWVDTVIMRISDMLISFPGMVLAIAVAGVLGASLGNAVLAITIVSWTKYARLSRSLVLKIRRRDYVDAAVVGGAKPSRILVRHMLPNILPTLVVTGATDIGTMMLELAALSFLGFGAQSPTAEWGMMLNEGRAYMQTAPWLMVFPGLAIFIVVVIFNLLGDSLRDVLDPRSSDASARRDRRRRLRAERSRRSAASAPGIRREDPAEGSGEPAESGRDRCAPSACGRDLHSPAESGSGTAVPDGRAEPAHLLNIRDISVAYGEDDQSPAVEHFSLDLKEGQIVSLVGESGSGKTSVIRAVIGDLSGDGRVSEGDIIYQGRSMLEYGKEDWLALRGTDISMIFQDAGAMLNPVRTIGSQYVEYILAHKNALDRAGWTAGAGSTGDPDGTRRKMTRKEAWALGERMLERMRLPDGDRIMRSYAFQLSGGMRQRVGIAMAMTFRPRLLLADEPTSALDVTTQAQIVRMMTGLRDEFGTAIILVTHNLGVAAYMSDEIIVMRDGRVTDRGDRDRVLHHPEDEYTKRLLAAVPSLEGGRYV